jgi:hypothetical protein
VAGGRGGAPERPPSVPHAPVGRRCPGRARPSTERRAACRGADKARVPGRPACRRRCRHARHADPVRTPGILRSSLALLPGWRRPTLAPRDRSRHGSQRLDEPAPSARTQAGARTHYYLRAGGNRLRRFYAATITESLQGRRTGDSIGKRAANHAITIYGAFQLAAVGAVGLRPSTTAALRAWQWLRPESTKVGFVSL